MPNYGRLSINGKLETAKEVARGFAAPGETWSVYKTGPTTYVIDNAEKDAPARSECVYVYQAESSDD